MDLLIDTQVLVWLGTNPTRLPDRVREAVLSPDTQNFVSAVVAYEFADLNRRGRFGVDLPLGDLLSGLDMAVLPQPAEAWRIAALLPLHHRDPVDRMLTAHALHADLTLVTADVTIRSYPIRTLW